MKKVHYLNIINFLAAFLLFQIELIISKIFLPKFGGSYLVWGGCVVFFQCALLAGYFYSHLVIQKLGVARYRWLHMAFVVLPLLFFPGRPLPQVAAHQNTALVTDIFMQLFFSVGLVFFVLSTASIISQCWLSGSELKEKNNPYALYAVSNLGSFSALLTYPFIFEALFDLNAQLAIWRIGYLALLVSWFIVLRQIKIIEPPKALKDIKKFNFTKFLSEGRQINDSVRGGLRWFLLGASGSMAFLAVTNVITYEITPAPLFWILPLSIYLVSFAFNFKDKPFCPAWIKNKFYLAAAYSAILFFVTLKKILPFTLELIAYNFSLFVICMFCQNELVLDKPKDKERLTLFYFVISLGSFLGGLFVTWVIPVLATTALEFLLSILVVYLALLIKEKVKKVPLRHIFLIGCLGIFMSAWPIVFKGYNIFGLLFLFWMVQAVYSRLKTNLLALTLSLVLLLWLSFSIDSLWSGRNYVYRHRNYYGTYRVFVENGTLFLMNGTTMHGAQYLSEAKRDEPLTYYHKRTPVGKLLDSGVFRVNNMGVVGLGAGTLAAYGKPGQEIDFYELDPDAIEVASLFTYLDDSQAKINYIVGDARVSLNKAADNRYNILIVDAFSGDSVPIHLLTIEAIAEYKKCITKDGILLMHISNRYLNLIPVLFSNADRVKASVCFSRNDKDKDPAYLSSEWVAITWDKKVFQDLTAKLEWKQDLPGKKPVKRIRPWTDTYSNILSVLRISYLLNAIKSFRPFYW